MSDVLIPILKNTKDPHYRYKMPKLTAKVEGSGNGIKTVITNMSAIARSLGRPPSYPTKYFGCELGAQVTMNNDLYVVNGSHDPDKLLKLLYDFIRKFVLCQKCNNPETTLTVKNQSIYQKCIACGHDTTINKAIHKITTFIINHPPDGPANGTSVSVASKSSKPTKADKKSKKNGDKTTSGQSPTNDGPAVIGHVNEEDDFDQFDDEELTTAAYSERMRELCDGLNNGMYLNDTKENANIFYKLVKERKEAGLLSDPNVQKEIYKEAERLDIKDKSTLVLSELLFTENIIEEIKANKMLLLRFCNKNKKAQKYLLGGFEKLVGDIYKDKLLNNAMKILKQFYDEDILDEETIIEWSAKESKKYVSKEMSRKIREKVALFIKWLKEAEVEDESSEDEEEGVTTKSNSKTPSLDDENEYAEEEDDDIELEFTHKANGIQVQEVKPVVQQLAVNKGAHEPEEDIDIDNI